LKRIAIIALRFMGGRSNPREKDRIVELWAYTWRLGAAVHIVHMIYQKTLIRDVW
jgi:hypothetical protein